MKPIHKFNNSRGATLCHKCSVIISIGLTEDLYCDKCKPKQEPNYNMKQEILAEMERSETLEEAAEREYPFNDGFQVMDIDISEELQVAFANGAKWQQEQYTIEEQHVGHTIDELDKEYIKGFNEGSAYYIERMYSEKDLEYAFEQGKLNSNICYRRTFKNLLEILQFKKK